MPVVPLFPLGTALMPGAFLPLQIFEPRYVVLLQDLLAGQPERDPAFGVVAIRKGHEVGEQGVGKHGLAALHTVGCMAHIVQAADAGNDRYLVVSQGRSRFRLAALVESPTPYFCGDVTWIEEVDGDSDEMHLLGHRLRAAAADFRAEIGVDEPEIPDDDRELSYWLPQLLDLDVGERQQLLMSQTTVTRLRLARHLVRREHALTSALGTLGRPEIGPISAN
ncbi:MAG: LON peptidase substrate-binding domain-containing protein [Ornithinimicrobium sp.]